MKCRCLQTKNCTWILVFLLSIALWIDDGVLKQATSTTLSLINTLDTGSVADTALQHTQTNLSIREPDKIQDTKKADAAPLFILHVGPPKTGTTTIQWYAANHEKQLNKHNIYYLGHYGKHAHQKLHPLSYACKQKKKRECRRAWKDLGRSVQEHYDKGHNVFMSEEIFSNYNSERHEKQCLFRYLMPMLEKWNVRIIVGYRRYFEWAPSWYAQMNQPNKINSLKVWPHEGGRYLPTFAEYMESSDITSASFNQLSSSKRKWSNHFPNSTVWIFNMHHQQKENQVDPKDALVQVTFFCSMIPEAPSFCNFVKNENVNETTTKNKSSSKALHLDMLLLEGYKRGWLKTKDMTRPSAQHAILQYAHQELNLTKPTDFGKMKCPSKEQTQQLLDLSLQLEEQLVPDFFASPMGEVQLRQQFQEAIDEYKFCSIDVDDALARKEKRWKRFFRDMNQNSK